MKEEKIGKVKHYFPEPQAALLELEGRIRKGDMVHIKGAKDDLVDRVQSLRMGERDVDEGSPGEEVGMKVSQPVHDNAEVYVLRE